RQVSGVDIAEPYVAYARARAMSGQPVFDLADICSLPYPDGAFAGSVAQLVLNFVPDTAAALSGVPRCTTPAGLVAAAGWGFPADVLGHRDGARPCRRHGARPAVLGAIGARRRLAETVCPSRIACGPAPVGHHSHGLHELRRLLGAPLWRARASRHLRGPTRT